jgi:hypothetical protein
MVAARISWTQKGGFTSW